MWTQGGRIGRAFLIKQVKNTINVFEISNRHDECSLTNAFSVRKKSKSQSVKFLRDCFPRGNLPPALSSLLSSSLRENLGLWRTLVIWWRRSLLQQENCDLYMNLGTWDFDWLWCSDICLSVALGIQDVSTPNWCLHHGLLTKKHSEDPVGDLLDSSKPSGWRSSPLNFRQLKVIQHLKIRQSQEFD